MKKYPKDITYCTNINCKRNCERRLDNKSFIEGSLFSMSDFEYLLDGFDVDKCEYYREEYNEKNLS